MVARSRRDRCGRVVAPRVLTVARCRNCKKSIKWIEVPVDTPAGTMFQWRTFERQRRDGIFVPHICKKQPPARKPLPVDPWWNR